LAKFYYGGQAVMEGVMMRGQRHMAVAVRAPDGTIVLHQEPLNAAIYRHPTMRFPFLRGLVALWDALGLGMKALIFSANVALQEPVQPGANTYDVAQEVEGAAATTALPLVPAPVSDDQEQLASNVFSGPVGWTTIAFALLMMVAVFFVLPVLAAGLLTSLANIHSGLAQNLIEGAIRLLLFLGYIWAVGRLPDIRRVFGYHGAEHKTINAYEAGAELTPESVQSFTLLNPRCGTTFLLIVLVLATIVFVLLGKLPFALTLLSRIILVPLIAAASYEFIRLMANLYHLAIVRAIMAPGLALQKMTTRPPDLSMIEVGIAALNAVLVADGVVLPSSPLPARASQTELEESVTTLA
jgi:uncharacterized protein YqhQ